jgi:hypothetical protein
MRIKNVLEIGGLYGYSATNFLHAVGEDGLVFSCDLNAMPKIMENHITIQKDARFLTPQDVLNKKIEMIFFDCHMYEVQIDLYNNLLKENIIDDTTIIALHDTNTHPSKIVDWSYEVSENEFVHQWVERKMVNYFVDLGYHATCFHTKMDSHDENLPFRHGITILSKFKHLKV